MSDLTEQMRVDLQVVSPVHIGTQGSLSSSEFLVNRGKTHILDEDRFAIFLKEKNLIETFVQAVSGRFFSMKDFFETQEGLSLKNDVEAISGVSIAGGASGMTEFRPFVRDGNGDIFLPGSAVKGVIRTALLYRLLQKNDKKRKKIEAHAREQLKTLPRTKEWFSEKWLQRDLLQNFSLPRARTSQTRDILRCLKVRDAYPASNAKTQVIRIQVLSKNKDDEFYWSHQKQGGRPTDQPLEIWVEALVSGTFRLDLIWDKVLFEHFRKENPKLNLPVNGLEELKAMVSEMSQQCLTHEKGFCQHESDTQAGGEGYDVSKPSSVAKVLGRWYENNGLSGEFMRIGFGSGMLNTTVNMLFEDEELRQEIRNRCGFRRGDDPAPKSRKVWGDYGQWLPMGWMRIWSPGEMGDRSGTRSRTGVISNLEKILRELSIVKSGDMGRIGTIIQKIDTLETDAEKGELAKAAKDRMGAKAFRKYKRKEYLSDLMAKISNLDGS